MTGAKRMCLLGLVLPPSVNCKEDWIQYTVQHLTLWSYLQKADLKYSDHSVCLQLN